MYQLLAAVEHRIGLLVGKHRSSRSRMEVGKCWSSGTVRSRRGTGSFRDHVVKPRDARPLHYDVCCVCSSPKTANIGSLVLGLIPPPKPRWTMSPPTHPAPSQRSRLPSPAWTTPHHSSRRRWRGAGPTGRSRDDQSPRTRNSASSATAVRQLSTGVNHGRRLDDIISPAPFSSSRTLPRRAAFQHRYRYNRLGPPAP